MKRGYLFPGVEPFPYVLGWRIALPLTLIRLGRNPSFGFYLSISKPASLL